MNTKRGRENKKESKSEGGRKLIFWNIAGLKSNDRDVWTFLKAGDFIRLTETWVEEKDIKYIENR